MAAAEVTISGILYDKVNRTQQNVVLIGDAVLTGLGVGGGPMPPGSGLRPEHPIYYPPDPGFGQPTPPGVIWGGRPGPGDGGSWVPAPPPDFPNPPDGMVKDPPAGGGWGYNTQYGWGYFPMSSAAGPKR